MMAKFAYVVCKNDANENGVINADVLKSNLNCRNIRNLSKRMPSEKYNFTGIEVKKLRRLRDDFSPFMLGMYDFSGLGSHRNDLYIFSEDAIERKGKNLELSLNLIKYGKNYFITFSASDDGLKKLFNTKDMLMWFLLPSSNPDSLSKDFSAILKKYPNVLDDDDIIYITNNCLLPYAEARERNDIVRVKLREKIISMLNNGWDN